MAGSQPSFDPTHSSREPGSRPGWHAPVLLLAALLVWLAVAPLAAQEPIGGPGGASPAAGAPATPPAASPAASDEQPGFFGILFSGGWIGVLIICLIFALSVAAAYLVFEQLIALRKSEIVPDGLGEQVRQQLAAGRVQEADQACRAQPSVLSFVLLRGLAEVDEGWPSVEKALEDATAEQSARLFRKVEYLSVIGNLAPMLGLLGTVTGMIACFREVASTKGAAGAAELAEGIYQALVTTVGGLVVAIPALGAFALLRNRVDQLVAEAAYVALHATAPIKRLRSATAPPAPGTPRGATPTTSRGVAPPSPPAPPAPPRG